MPSITKTPNPEYVRRFNIGRRNAKWAVIMAKVGIRRAIADTPWPEWQLLTFTGPKGRESRGVVDLIAIRKDHGKPPSDLKLGDALQIILIQAKGGSAARPTEEDAKRLRIVALRHGACGILLASWKKGKAAEFFSLGPHSGGSSKWIPKPADDLRKLFGPSKGIDRTGLD